MQNSFRGAEVWLACHECVGAELHATFPEMALRIRLVRDTQVQKLAFRYGVRRQNMLDKLSAEIREG